MIGEASRTLELTICLLTQSSGFSGISIGGPSGGKMIFVDRQLLTFVCSVESSGVEAVEL